MPVPQKENIRSGIFKKKLNILSSKKLVKSEQKKEVLEPCVSRNLQQVQKIVPNLKNSIVFHDFDCFFEGSKIIF